MSQNLSVQKLGLLMVVAVGFLFAWFAGNYIAEENYLPIAAVLGSLVAITVFFGVGKSIFLLIPICWGLTGKISVLPLPFDIRQLTVIAATGVFFGDVIFKRRIAKQRYRILDVILFVNLICLAIGFLTHPVGVAAIGGGERVGGRPYLDVMLGVMTYLILSRQKAPLSYFIKLPAWTLWVAMFGAFAGAVGRFFPAVGEKLAYLYSDFAPGCMIDGDLIGNAGGTDFGENRMTFLLYAGTSLCLFIASRIDPAKLVRIENLRQGFLYVTGILMVMLSGYRDGLVNIILCTMAASVLRQKIVGIVKIGFIGIIIALAGILMSYTNMKLPFTFQRTLSFLPGNWDAEAVESAKDSSEWRYRMWEEVIRSDRYIKNKIFGDGFGIPRAEYEEQLSMMKSGNQSGYQGELAAQEAFMINGDFHSGPLTTVRVMGVVGLFLFIPLIIGIAFQAHSLIRLSIGTPLQACCLYYGIGFMIFPVFFLFVFGDLKGDFVNALYSLGMINMISSALEDHLASNPAIQGSALPASRSIAS